MKIIGSVVSAAVLSISVLTAGSAHAGIATCENIVVNAVDVAASGLVFVTGTGPGSKFEHDVICSISGQYGNYSGEACKEVVKLLTTALLSGKKAALWFNSATATCTPAAWEDTVVAGRGFYHASLQK